MTKLGGYIRKKGTNKARLLEGWEELRERKKLCEVFGLYLARSSIEWDKLFSGWVKHRTKICN